MSHVFQKKQITQPVTLTYLLILVLSNVSPNAFECLSLTTAPHIDALVEVLAVKLLFSNQVKCFLGNG